LLLLHGGGNLGDLWQPHQVFRAQVLADFGDRPIVQLPQTIHFENDENVEITKRSFSGHPQFTLLVRDQKSLLFAQQRLDSAAVLCPDSAYALGKMTRSGPPAIPILWLGRTDHEAAEQADDAELRTDGIERADWVGRRSAGPRDSLARAGGELLALAAARFSSLPATVLDGLWGEWERLAWRRVRVGQQILSRGEVVITDRLHAHILCSLLDLPHVVLDNSYGKLSSYAQSWDTLGERALWADSPAEAIALARAMSRAAA
jgi:exopolysaccharide biosynthesis predicted pyruvyltransferase EpsI